VHREIRDSNWRIDAIWRAQTLELEAPQAAKRWGFVFFSFRASIPLDATQDSFCASARSAGSVRFEVFMAGSRRVG
jgi:hypothetical protein